MAVAISERLGRAAANVLTGECESILLRDGAWRCCRKPDGGGRNATNIQLVMHAAAPRLGTQWRHCWHFVWMREIARRALTSQAVMPPFQRLSPTVNHRFPKMAKTTLEENEKAPG
jgi:hypothetical protein